MKSKAFNFIGNVHVYRHVHWLIIILFLLFIIKPFSSKPIINTNKTNFIDRSNRLILFHGISLLQSEPSFMYNQNENEFNTLDSLSNIDIQFLIDMGINLIKIGIVWEDFETKENEFNFKYIDYIESIINRLGEAGIFTYLVNHQSLFSSKFCGFGVPLFYITNDTFQSSCEDDMLNRLYKLIGLCRSVTDQIEAGKASICLEMNEDLYKKIQYSIEISSLYETLYDSSSNLHKSYLRYINKISQKFYNHRFIVGFDPWNNLQVPNTHNSLLSHLPSYQVNRSLTSFYENIIQNNPLLLRLIYSNPIYPDSEYTKFNGYSFKSIRSHENMSSSTSSSSFIFSDRVNLSCLTSNNPQSTCTDYISKKVNNINNISSYLNLPAIISSFDDCQQNIKDDSNKESFLLKDSDQCYIILKNLINVASQRHLSWIYPYYKSFSKYFPRKYQQNHGVFIKSNLNLSVIKAITHPYIQAYPINNIELVEKTIYIPSNRLFYSKFYIKSENEEEKTKEKEIEYTTCMFLSNKLYDKKGLKLTIIYNSKDFLTKSVKTFDGRRIELEINPNASNNELNKVFLGYLSVTIIRKIIPEKDKSSQLLPIEIVVSPQIRYRYSVLHEERSKVFIGFNIKISDINNPFSYLVHKKNIVYIRTKGVSTSFDHQVYLEFKVEDRLFNRIENLDLTYNAETKMIKQKCEFNNECLIDYVYIEYMRILLIDSAKDLIQWEFYNMNNHRVLINFS